MSVGIYNYAPCALHIRLNLTKLFFCVIIQDLLPTYSLDGLWEELRALQLQFFNSFLTELLDHGVFDKARIHPIGRDCDKLEANFGSVLAHLREREALNNPGHLIKHELLWARWWYDEYLYNIDHCLTTTCSCVAPYLRATHLTEKENTECVDRVTALAQHFEREYHANDATTYLHWITKHLPDWTSVLSQEFELAYGALSSQATEHGIKLIKHQIKHSLQTNDSIPPVPSPLCSWAKIYPQNTCGYAGLETDPSTASLGPTVAHRALQAFYNMLPVWKARAHAQQ